MDGQQIEDKLIDELNNIAVDHFGVDEGTILHAMLTKAALLGSELTLHTMLKYRDTYKIPSKG